MSNIEGESVPPGVNYARRPSRFSQQIENLLQQGRRHSAANIIRRLRSGSLSG